MATKTIPAKTETTCDKCGCVCTKCFGSGRRIMDGTVTLYRHGIDFGGNPCGPAGFNIELCDNCIIEVENLINKFLSD